MVTAPSWRTSPGFLSTPSARRATGFIDLVHDLQKFLSTPSARRATKDGKSRWRPHQNFYPRPPRGGRRFMAWVKDFYKLISIHALREEGDAESFCNDARHAHFYPRPPRGGRHHCRCVVQPSFAFLSTPSARRATLDGLLRCTGGNISIHALREEGDFCSFSGSSLLSNFYPRPPRGGRPLAAFRLPAPTSYFYPRPPRGGRRTPCPRLRHSPNFYPRPPRGGRPAVASISAFAFSISIHALREEGDA